MTAKKTKVYNVCGVCEKQVQPRIGEKHFALTLLVDQLSQKDDRIKSTRLRVESRFFCAACVQTLKMNISNFLHAITPLGTY